MKISLILPYWDRQAAADKALALLDQHYAGLDLEVIVVDDGNSVPFQPQPGPLNVRVIYLPVKDEPKSPATCWNVGAKAATGDILVLSCIEILHEQPVLKQLAHAVIEGGPDAYVLAAAYCPESKEWHCHSTERATDAPELPEGFGRAFCGAMHRDLYFRAGGWDEDYREGAGYEDIDFARRMQRAGAVPQIRDDLIVTHPKTGARIAWPPEKFLRNEAILRSKWTPPVTFVCLKAGPMYGPEYVNILRDMVARCLPLGYPGRFVCITDDPSGLDAGIETLPLPADLERWWGKLWMFNRGLFPDGSRMVFMDLDTVIVGRLDDIVGYRGQFATLHDFYTPERLGPAVMLWEAGGAAARIWDAWEAAGKPRNDWGDLWWINQLEGGEFARNADVLQKLLPGQFCSFKAHCRPMYPRGTRVVCFHGEPRPHNAGLEWVQMAWRVGGGSVAELELVANTARETVAENVRLACARDLPRFNTAEFALERAVAIVGGGPSLVDTLDELRLRVQNGCLVFAVNGAVHYLASEGIKTDVQVIIDSRVENVRFVDPPMAERYYVASQCAPGIFDALASHQVTLMHMNTAGIAETLPAGESADELVSSGSTVGLAALVVAYRLGHRTMHLFGFDSSYEEVHHAYPQPANDADSVIEATAGGRTFKAAPWMVAQVNEFVSIAGQLAQADCVVTVSGDGLLPHAAHEMTKPAPDPIANLPTNTPAEILIEQARVNLARDLPQFREIDKAHVKTAIIVGGGPSLADNLPKLQQLRNRGAVIFALNGTHDWLIDRGIVPNFCVMADARPDNVQFVQGPQDDVTYLLASQCHPSAFDALAGYDVIVWTAYVEGIEPVIDACGKPVIALGGGATVGLKTMTIASLWGFRNLHLFGFDSCYRGGANHAYPQPMNDAESVLDVDFSGRKFRCAPWMIQQAQGFEQQAPLLRAAGCRIKVHGEGLIALVAQQQQLQEAA